LPAYNFAIPSQDFFADKHIAGTFALYQCLAIIPRVHFNPEKKTGFGK
jgi:hypothetical protein